MIAYGAGGPGKGINILENGKTKTEQKKKEKQM